MAKYKFVAEFYFEAETMDDALASLGEHFLKCSRSEVTHLLDEGSFMALGEPEFDKALENMTIGSTTNAPEGDSDV
jgi:hypothetical protein